MTEAEWLLGTDPVSMLEFLRGKGGSDRKFRLFAVACYRRIEDERTNDRCRRSIQAAERFADDGCSDEELAAAHLAAQAVADLPIAVMGAEEGILAAVAAATTTRPAWMAAVETSQRLRLLLRGTEFDAAGLSHGNEDLSEEWYAYAACLWRAIGGEAQAQLVREIFPNPFRRHQLESFWLTWNDGTVPKLALAIYQDRAFDRLPILADALEDAGCNNADIIAHCRSAGEHVRGCWLVDLILGKH
jgi:hypothetical protein